MQQQLNPVLIPLIRRVMPNLIAQDIIGVSPMTGPAAQIFKLRSRYRYHNIQPLRYPVLPGVYRHFLRINNRRRTQNDDDLGAAGYASVTLPTDRTPLAMQERGAEIDAWCRENLGQDTWLRLGRSRTWWFSRDNDAVLFGMVWA